jgi:hypothetical protein
LFNSKRRIASAWAKGLMLGKAVGARDERDRIIDLLTGKGAVGTEAIIKLIKGETND